MTRAAPPDVRPALPPPSGLTVLVGDDEAIMCFPVPGQPGASQALTRAESEVLVALLEGATNDELARTRGRSVRTVANQVASLLRKLRVTSRFELAARVARVLAGE